MLNLKIEKGLRSRTLIIGILNITPDSFSDGGLYLDPKKALKRAIQMVKEGADIIDVGGESTRPGSLSISIDEELQRVLPVIRAIKKKFGNTLPISIDTYKAIVAEESLRAGATMVNSLGGFSFDKSLAEVIATYRCQIVLYHIKGKPKTMQQGRITYRNVVKEIEKFFRDQVAFGVKRGIKEDKFILDPGIGFGKNLEHNLEIIRRFEKFKTFDLPLMVGVSRKSHLGEIIKQSLKLTETPKPEERIEAGLAEVGIAVLHGATIVRTHDVLATKKFLSVLDRLT